MTTDHIKKVIIHWGGRANQRTVDEIEAEMRLCGIFSRREALFEVERISRQSGDAVAYIGDALHVYRWETAQ